MERVGQPEPPPDSVGAEDALDILATIEREVAASPLVPGGLIALNVERVAGLTARLRAVLAAPPPVEPAHAIQVRRAEAEAALILEEAHRTFDLLLSGPRVDGLRAAEVERLLREGRQQGDALVNAAYTDADSRITEARSRADAALRHVTAACDEVRAEPPGPARRLAAAVGARTGTALSRLLARLLGA